MPFSIHSDAAHPMSVQKSDNLMIIPIVWKRKYALLDDSEWMITEFIIIIIYFIAILLLINFFKFKYL